MVQRRAGRVVSAQPTVVVADNDPPFFSGLEDPALGPLRGLGEVVVHSPRSRDRSEFLGRIAPATALIYLRRPWPLDEDAFAAAPNLQIVSFPGVGVDRIDLDAARRHRVTVSNLPGANAAAVAEHTIGLLFAVARQIPAADASMRDGRWQKREGVELAGRTLGVLGLGAIGSRVAALGLALGMNVLAWSFTEDGARAARLGVELVARDELFRRSDVLAIHLRLTPQSAGLVGADQLRLLRPGAILLNTARAAIIDQPALLEALSSGRLAGFGTDVFPDEPADLENNPYLKFDNVVMTPHLADETLETNARLRQLVVENVTAYYAGRPQNVVT